jgi:hypothetical protein
MLDRLKALLKERRRRQLDREAREQAALIRQAYRYARYDRFLASIVAYHRRKGYVTPRQARWLPAIVRRAYWTSEGA